MRRIEDYKATLVTWDVDALTPTDLISLRKTTQELLHREMFKVPQEVGPFLVKQREALKIAEGLPRGICFEHAGA